jgi:hypothetical protein
MVKTEIDMMFGAELPMKRYSILMMGISGVRVHNRDIADFRPGPEA